MPFFDGQNLNSNVTPWKIALINQVAPVRDTPGRTHYADVDDSPEMILELARDLTSAGATDDAVSLLEAFVRVCPEQAAALDAIVTQDPDLSACGYPRP